MSTLRLLTAVCSFLVIISCGERTIEIKNPAVLGKWENETQAVTLSADGKVKLTDKTAQTTTTGSFRFINENRLRVTFKSATDDYKLSLSGDTLRIERVNGGFNAEYKRA